MKSDVSDLRSVLLDLRSAFARKENVMARARQLAGKTDNSVLATLVAYDLQAGSYVASARANPTYRSEWANQLAELICPFLGYGDRLLEVGVGEATTLAYVAQALSSKKPRMLGFDVSWSRVAVARSFVCEKSVDARLFVADLFRIPLADQSVDVVYSSHSLEPNGGREEEAIAECLRVARKAVVLVEPIYELAPKEAQARMESHGYVRDLMGCAKRLGADVHSLRLLDLNANPLNPSGALILKIPGCDGKGLPTIEAGWECPLTSLPLQECDDLFLSVDSGLAYPVMRGIPLLRQEHAVVASRLISGG